MFCRVLVTRICVLVPTFFCTKLFTWENLIHLVGCLTDIFNSFLQGFASGLMLSISFLDLAHNAINSIGFFKANLWVSTSVHLVLQWFLLFK